MSDLELLNEFSSRYRFASSNDVDELSEICSTSFNPCKFSLRQRSDKFRSSISKFEFAGFKLAYYEANDALIHQTLADADDFCITIPISGSVSISDRNLKQTEITPGACGIYQKRGGTVCLYGENLRLISLRIPSKILTDRIQSAFYHTSLQGVQFTPLVNARHGSGALLIPSIAHLMRLSVSSPDLRDSPILSMNLIDFIISVIFCVIPGNRSAVVSDIANADWSRIVARAEKYMQDCAGSPISLADIARAARCPERTLHTVFQKQRGTTPILYLRDVRLHEARKNLQTTDETIAEIAVKWGFSNQGRFAQYYRERFGELPSETRRFSHGPGELTAFLPPR